MKPHSPTLEGFKAIWRKPSVGSAEIAWRWSLGFAGVSLLTLGFLEYLDTLPVTPEDIFLLRTRHPVLVGRALEHVLRGSSVRLLGAGLVLGLAFAIAWVGVATLGRAITIRALLDYFAERALERELPDSWRLRSLAGLNSFRSAATLAAAVGLLGALVLGGAVSTEKDPSPGSAALVFLVVLTLVSLAWLVVNWFLSLASVFAVAEGENTFGAIASAAGLCRERTGAVLAVSFWFGLAHLVAFFLATSAVGFPLAFVPLLPAGVVLGGVLLVTLLYFAAADFIYVGRLAAYLYIAEGPGEALSLDLVPPEPMPSEERVDANELILSDLPTSVET